MLPSCCQASVVADPCAAKSALIGSFDDVAPNGLDSLVALRRKVSPGLRFVKRLRLLQAVPFGDAHTLRSCRPLLGGTTFPPAVRSERLPVAFLASQSPDEHPRPAARYNQLRCRNPRNGKD
jgi:hypothetical protein